MRIEECRSFEDMKDKIFNKDSMEGMKMIPDNSIDCIVTSPPYDDLRKYGGVGTGWSFEKFQQIAAEIARVLTDGGVCVWSVNDATINGSETGTSFRQALYFKDECGLNLHDTMLYMKQNPMPLSGNRYNQCFEYMFVFSKGTPKTFNPIMEKCKYAGAKNFGKRSIYQTEGSVKENEAHKVIGKTKKHSNAFTYLVGSLTESAKIEHPAMFPLELAKDQVISWSNENDVVLDPFMGSATTAIACIKEKRRFIGFELNKEYYDKAIERINREMRQLTFEFEYE